MADLPPPKKKFGCLKSIAIVVLIFGVMKGCSAYYNRPVALYERWLKDPVPEDVTELKGGNVWQLTEPIMWLKFKAPPERISQIVATNGLKNIEAEPAWHLPADSRKLKIDGRIFTKATGLSEKSLIRPASKSTGVSAIPIPPPVGHSIITHRRRKRTSPTKRSNLQVA